MAWTFQIVEEIAAARWTGTVPSVMIAFSDLPLGLQSKAKAVVVEGVSFSVTTAAAVGTRRPRLRWRGPSNVVLQLWPARDTIIAGLAEDWVMSSLGGEPAAGAVLSTHRESIPSVTLLPDHTLEVDLQGAQAGDAISPLVVHGRILLRQES